MSFGDGEFSESSQASDQRALADFVDMYYEGSESEEVDSNASDYIRHCLLAMNRQISCIMAERIRRTRTVMVRVELVSPLRDWYD